MNAILIAGTHSGVGKTTVSIGLMASLYRRGYKVQPFKIGPDFIDPSHHSSLCSQPSRNLDDWMMGEKGVLETFYSASRDADISVIEGVMGLYDGLEDSEIASTAHIAKILKVPVILVINAHGMSRSIAALVKGYVEYDSKVNIIGVILNMVGSDKHASILKKVLDIPILGILPRNEQIKTPSRHLGLYMAFEDKKNLDLLSDFIESNVDIDNILSKSWMPDTIKFHPLQSYPSKSHRCDLNEKVKIGVAYDSAFCFYYKDNLDALKKLGADLVFFSLMDKDNKMPDIDGLYIGGGYPELYAKKLEKSGIRMQIKYEAQNGMPIYAECGGMIYLCKSLDKFKMADVLPAEVSMTNKLQALGYTIGEVINDNAIAKKGLEVRGHEFHYSKIEHDRDATFAYQLKRGKGIYDGKDGLIEYNVMASYMHVHSATFPFDRFLESCKEFKRR